MPSLDFWMFTRGSPGQGVLNTAWDVPLWRGSPEKRTHHRVKVGVRDALWCVTHGGHGFVDLGHPDGTINSTTTQPLWTTLHGRPANVPRVRVPSTCQPTTSAPGREPPHITSVRRRHGSDKRASTGVVGVCHGPDLRGDQCVLAFGTGLHGCGHPKLTVEPQRHAPRGNLLRPVLQ